VAEHEHGGIGGGEEEVVEPVVVAVDGSDLTGLDVHGEEAHGEFGGPTLFHHLAFVAGLIEGVGLLLLLCRSGGAGVVVVAAVAFDVGAGE
jgi:hypothetical protein